MIRDARGFAAGLFCIAFGVAFALGARTHRVGTGSEMGPGYVPLILGVVLAILGLVIAAGAASRRAPNERWANLVPLTLLRPATAICAALAAAALTLERLGLVVAVPLVVVLAALGSRETRVLETAAQAVLLTLLCWLLFVKALGVRIPVAPWLGAD
jgi:uncharacterized membrane protein YidH (DUF202 family)